MQHLAGNEQSLVHSDDCLHNSGSYNDHPCLSCSKTNEFVTNEEHQILCNDFANDTCSSLFQEARQLKEKKQNFNIFNVAIPALCTVDS